MGKTYATAAGPFHALREVSLRILPGEFVAVVGKSGSGKTTLLHLMAGIDLPTEGEVTVLGQSLAKTTEDQRARFRGVRLGVVFQFFQLLPTLTVVENVVLPMDLGNVWPRAERPKRAMALLERFGVGAQAGKLPAALSGGEQQRVAIARALANDPPIVLADEPTGNLDSGASEIVVSALAALASEGKTVVMVTHERNVAVHFTRTLELADGRIADALPPARRAHA
ncbi:MAG TPA: ABC transporter ATP-binding protein [Polyangiaceae bacterium]